MGGLSLGLSISVVVHDLNNHEENSTTQVYINARAAVKWAFIIPMYGIVLLIGSYLSDITSRKRFLQRILMVKQQNQIIKEKTFNETMQKQFLESILPSNLVEKLQKQQEKITVSLTVSVKRGSLSQKHLGVSMLYADLVGFTSFSAQVDPFKVMMFLNELFQVFDGLCDDFNVYKIETVGDCYVAAVGVVTGERVSSKVDALGCETKKYTLGCGTKHSDVSFNLAGKFSKTTTQSSGITQVSSMINGAALVNARDLMGFAKAMIWGSRKVMKPVEHTPAVMRVGVHTGSRISGIMGTRNMKF